MTLRDARAALCALIATSAFAAGSAAASPPGTVWRPVAPAAADAQGAQLYRAHCAGCHGLAGDARTGVRAALASPPTDFTAPRPTPLDVAAVITVTRDGRPGTAMPGFARRLPTAQIEAVAGYVAGPLAMGAVVPAPYHGVASGPPEADRARRARPYVTGEAALDTPWETLTPREADGRRLYLSICIACHAPVSARTLEWDLRAVSFPLGDASCTNCHDRLRAGLPPEGRLPVSHPGWTPSRAGSGGSPYDRHEIAPVLEGASALERRGEALYQKNCAFCHAADGTGLNWIGAFMEPHPRNLTDRAFMSTMTRTRLREVIREGLPGTSMPAWKSVLEDAEVDAIVAYVNAAFHPLAAEPAARQRDR